MAKFKGLNAVGYQVVKHGKLFKILRLKKQNRVVIIPIGDDMKMAVKTLANSLSEAISAKIDSNVGGYIKKRGQTQLLQKILTSRQDGKIIMRADLKRAYLNVNRQRLRISHQTGR